MRYLIVAWLLGINTLAAAETRPANLDELQLQAQARIKEFLVS